jgi:hypothetical protein
MASDPRTKDIPGPPGQTFAKDYVLKLGGVQVEAHSYGRGHTGDDTMVYFPDLKIVMVSDQITDNAPIVDFANGGSAVGWAPILDGVLKLDFEMAIPGRGGVLQWECSKPAKTIRLARNGFGEDIVGAACDLDRARSIRDRLNCGRVQRQNGVRDAVRVHLRHAVIVKIQQPLLEQRPRLSGRIASRICQRLRQREVLLERNLPDHGFVR